MYRVVQSIMHPCILFAHLLQHKCYYCMVDFDMEKRRTGKHEFHTLYAPRIGNVWMQNSTPTDIAMTF